jgi:hypothetical protein
MGRIKSSAPAAAWSWPRTRRKRDAVPPRPRHAKAQCDVLIRHNAQRTNVRRVVSCADALDQIPNPVDIERGLSKVGGRNGNRIITVDARTYPRALLDGTRYRPRRAQNIGPARLLGGRQLRFDNLPNDPRLRLFCIAHDTRMVNLMVRQAKVDSSCSRSCCSNSSLVLAIFSLLANNLAQY